MRHLSDRLATLLLVALATAPAEAQLVNRAVVDSSSHQIRNVAGVIATNLPPFPTSNVVVIFTRVAREGSVTSTVVASADLEVTKTPILANVVAGDQVVFRIEATNLGPSSAQDLVITDTLPAALTFLALDAGGGSCTTPAVGASGTVTCTFAGPTLPSVVRAIEITAQTAVTYTGPDIENVGSASSTTPDPASTNDQATATVAVTAIADLGITKTATPANVVAGDEVVFRIEATNLGPSSAQDLVITDTLPAALTFLALDAGGGSCTTPAVGASGTVTCTFAGPTLPTAARAIEITVQTPATAPPSGLVVDNVASTSSATSDPASTNDRAAAAVAIGAVSVLEIPTASETALIFLALALAGAGAVALRRT